MKPWRQRILATRNDDGKRMRIELHDPVVAWVPLLDSVVGGWWYRAGGYPPGEVFGTFLG